MTTTCTCKSTFKVLIYTLAVLATQDLDREANAALNIKPTQPETGNFLAQNNATTPALTRPVAPPEIKTHVAFPNSQSLAAPTQIFTPYLDQIRASLPLGWLMRLPSQVGEGARPDRVSSYVVRVSSANSQPALTVSLLTCKESQSCLVGSFAVSSKISLAAQAEFKQHQDAATPIALAHNIQGYLLEGTQNSRYPFSSVMWEQDDQLYTVRVPAQSRQNLLSMATSMASSTPIQNRTASASAPNGAANVPGSVAPTSQSIPESKRTENPQPHQPPAGSNREATQQQYKPSPLQQPPTRLINLETANQLPAGAVQIGIIGDHQTLPANNISGTGYEIYYTSVDWGATDWLQLGLAAALFPKEPTVNPVNGQNPEFSFLSIAPNFKYRLFKEDRLAVGVSGAAELFRLSTSPGFFNNRPVQPTTSQNNTISGYSLIGSVQVPVTYNLSPKLQVDLTPGVVYYPGTVKGAPFFGTFLNLGAGFNLQTSQQLSLFANANLPLVGNNAFRSQDSSFFKRVVWTAGARFALNPTLAVDVYSTNAFGSTPTTSLLAFTPDGNQVQIGATLIYMPDSGHNYARSFRKQPIVPLANRDRQLLLDGFTLTTASTLPTNELGLRAGLSSEGNSSFNLAYGVTNDLQLEAVLEQFGGGGRVNSQDTAGSGVKIGPAAKLRFLDQVQGDPFSLSFKLSALTDLSANQQGRRVGFGTILTELPLVYQPTSKVALFFDPKGAFYGRNRLLGVGLGVNYAVSDGVQLIGELTPVFDITSAFASQRSVWSVGVRYLVPKSDLGIDVYGSNAIGDELGGLVGDSKAGVGFKVHWLFGGGK